MKNNCLQLLLGTSMICMISYKEEEEKKKKQIKNPCVRMTLPERQ